jgi:hypothetical protein
MAVETSIATEPTDDITVSGNADAGFAVPVSEPVETEGEADAESDVEAVAEESDATKAAKTLAAQKKKKDPAFRKQSIQAEIDADIKRRTTARQEADAEEARLTKLREDRAALERPAAQKPVAAPEPDGKPRLKTYEDQIGTTYDTYAEAVEAYTDARDEWRDEQRAKSEHARASDESRTAAQRQWQERAAAFKAKTPDFDEVIHGAQIPDTASGRRIIAHLQRTEYGPQLAYELGTRPDELARIASLPEAFAVEALGELKAELKAREKAATTGPASSVPVKTSANPPIKPVSGSPVTSDDEGDPDDLSESAVNRHISRENARAADRRRR